ncbi:hypothetical protein [Anaeromusa sp.]|uniref:hypothetical protein n=1 Tax=Anaeromusa sp. TaxID=1872520 RepID=UPI00260EADAF|nr:hypothetical protein [Anaeromusa sp.]MDD3156991.1 hypothetical protein [Anaeromusa sp.]
MVYLVRVESKKRIKGISVAANIAVEEIDEKRAQDIASRMFAHQEGLALAAVKVTKVSLEVA